MTTATTKSVTTKDGRVSYAETGQGRPLVLLHSLLTDRRAFDRVLSHLPGRIITLDLPGFGSTDRAASIEDFADLMADATEQVCADDGPVTMMGNGLGSFVALGIALRHPHLLRRLVLVGAGATFPEAARPVFGKMADLVAAGGMSAVTPVALRRIFTEDYLEAHPEEAEERAAVLARTDTVAFIAACRALEHVDFTGSVVGLAAPTLIVVGEEDQATPPAMAAHLHGLLPDSQMVTLPGIAHAPQLQDPPGFVNTVATFLEGE